MAGKPSPIAPPPPAAAASRSASISSARLVPARVYLASSDIPPPGVAAYGVVAFRSKPTSATRARSVRVCEAFKAYLPSQASLPASVPLEQQMLTIWPLDDPQDRRATDDDCDFLLDHYDLYGGMSAIEDAVVQGASIGGEGPFLIGWSPSNTRGVRDKVVLVVDLTGIESQDSLNELLLFWQKKVIEDASLWREGFSMERLRLSIRDFVDHYGSDILSAVKLVGGKG